MTLLLHYFYFDYRGKELISRVPVCRIVKPTSESAHFNDFP